MIEVIVSPISPKLWFDEGREAFEFYMGKEKCHRAEIMEQLIAQVMGLDALEGK